MNECISLGKKKNPKAPNVGALVRPPTLPTSQPTRATFLGTPRSQKTSHPPPHRGQPALLPYYPTLPPPTPRTADQSINQLFAVADQPSPCLPKNSGVSTVPILATDSSSDGPSSAMTAQTCPPGQASPLLTACFPACLVDEEESDSSSGSGPAAAAAAAAAAGRRKFEDEEDSDVRFFPLPCPWHTFPLPPGPLLLPGRSLATMKATTC